MNINIYYTLGLLNYDVYPHLLRSEAKLGNSIYRHISNMVSECKYCDIKVIGFKFKGCFVSVTALLSFPFFTALNIKRQHFLPLQTRDILRSSSFCRYRV